MSKDEKSSKFSNHTVTFPNRKEFLSLKGEILNESIYHFEKIEAGSVIIDVGAYIGLSTLYFYERYKPAKIESFEPGREPFNYLKENCNHLEGVSLHNKGIARQAGVRKFYATQDQDWMSNSSLINNSWTGVEKVEEYEIEVLSLTEVLRKYQEVSLLKIDIEGYEHSLLKKDLDLGDVLNLVVEVHPIGKNMGEKISRFLHNSGYKLSFIQDGAISEKIDYEELYIIKGIRG